MLRRTLANYAKPINQKAFSTLLLTSPLTTSSQTLASANLSALNCTQKVTGSEPIHILSPCSLKLTNPQALIHDSVATSTILTHESFENPTSSVLLAYLKDYLV